jgi:hypothetical protein
MKLQWQQGVDFSMRAKNIFDITTEVFRWVGPLAYMLS